MCKNAHKICKKNAKISKLKNKHSCKTFEPMASRSICISDGRLTDSISVQAALCD